MTTPQQPATSSSTSSGLAPNVAGALSYVLGFITGIIFLVIEKENRFVRFHAAQAITVTGLFILADVVLLILGMVPFIGWIIGAIAGIVMFFGGFILWIMLMVKAYQGKEWEVPFAGQWARKLVGSF